MLKCTTNWVVFCAAALLCLTGAASVGRCAQAARERESAVELFESKVRPLLAGSCAKCHGATSASGGLRVDSLVALLKGGGRGAAIVPGKPDSSLLLRAIEQTGRAPAMPPGGKLSVGQIAAVKEWIAQGAVWPGNAQQDNAATTALWSTRPIVKPTLPKVRRSGWAANSIDYYVLAHLEAKGMTPAPPAGKRELLRRVTYDITGLPPTQEETAAFLIDQSPNSYSKVVNRLLNSPRYGERWARHWLDLVRYADTSGYERDAEKPYSWKYRDWVIQSLNDDKPYNRFVTEQLAGDELPDRSVETVTATGFLRLGTWDDEPNDPLAYKYDRLDDLVHATATAFLGLTVRCARCHDHKFDPIPQKDYYAFAANFYAGYLDPGDGKLFGGPPAEKLGFPVLGFTDRDRIAPALHLLQNGDARREQDAVPAGYLSLVPGFKPAELGPVSEGTTTLRRTQLASWITDERNPLTARVIVNRIWQHHFGNGIVRTPNNFGRKGALPTNPGLLDWLAYTFVHEDHWSIKALHKRILMSSCYRMSSNHPAQAAYSKRDFLNENLWRFDRQRLDADELRDSMLFVGGDLNSKAFGPGFVPTVTREALEGLSRKGAEWLPSPPDEQRRRTIYMFLKRALIMPLLTVFDFADTTEPLEQRDVTTVAPQSLALLNNPFSSERSEAFARRVAVAAGANRANEIQQAWQFAYGRRPDAWEAKQALEFIAGYATATRSDPFDPALVSLCHTLLNSNEFLYID